MTRAPALCDRKSDFCLLFLITATGFDWRSEIRNSRPIPEMESGEKMMMMA